MSEIGQVMKVQGEDVHVRLLRQEACAKCGACTAGLDSKDMFVDAENLAKAKANDWVEIQLEEANFIKAVMIMYLIPLGGLLAGLFLGSILGMLLLPKAVDILAIVCGLSGAGLSFFLIHKNEHRFKTKRFKPKAIRISETAASCESK